MNRERVTSVDIQLMLASIPSVPNSLSTEQRELLDALWGHLCHTGESFPKRKLLHVLGKRPISDIMSGMAPGLMLEQFEAGEKCYSVTMLGALSSSNGARLIALYAHLLDLVKTLHAENNDVSGIDSDLIREKLALSDSDLSQLGSFARIVSFPEMPIHFSGQMTDRSIWYLSIREDVVDLFHAASSLEYFVQKLVRGWPPIGSNYTQEPVLAGESIGTWWYENGRPATTPNRAYDFVASVRIEALRGCERVEFDCTRLICLCEELNACAAGRHAHAVILLTRAILDHIPPVFGFGSFTEVSSNYGGGGRSFKASAERLEKQARKVADRMLHQTIRVREVAPEMQEVEFSRELETVLAEVCRLLKPLR